MGAGQGKTCFCMYCNIYHIYTYHFGTHQVSGCFVIDQKNLSSTAMTQIVKKFPSLVLSRESVLPHLRQEIRSV